MGHWVNTHEYPYHTYIQSHYPLVMTNTAMEAMAHRWLDGLPNSKMVDLSMATC